MQRYRILIVNVLFILMFVGAAWSRHLDSVVFAQPDVLRSANFAYDGWQTHDITIPENEMQMLTPDMALVRNYVGPQDNVLQLAVIAGHRKRSIHTPSFCMLGDGWEVISQSARTMNLNGVPIPVTQSILMLNGHSILMTYYFTDGEYRSATLVPFQFVQLMKRFRSTVTIGALVRVIVPYHQGDSSADIRTTDFLTRVSPKVDSILRVARLQMK